MDEKVFAGIGGGLILLSFGIIVSFFVFQGVEDKVTIQNGTPGFTQLRDLSTDTKEKIENNSAVEEFKKLVGNVTKEMKEKITVGVNSTFPQN